MSSSPKTQSKPKIAVYKFSSCDGCQLSILNLEDELLDLVSVVDIAYFLEASRLVKPGPYDIGIVEGSVSTNHEVERIRIIREECKFLITLGTCATAGGIQALRNFMNTDDLAQNAYPHPEYLNFLKTSTSISSHVSVDLEIWGCPVNKGTVLEVLTALVQNRKPNFPPSPVCIECKRAGYMCVAVLKGIPCLGPVVHGGCGALCPAQGRGCYGCYGPSSNGNFTSLVTCMVPLDRFPNETMHLLRNISVNAPAFRSAADTVRNMEPRKENKR